MTQVRIVTVPDMSPDCWVSVAAGTPLLDSIPKCDRVVLRLNDQYLLRADWPLAVDEDDRVEWLIEQPEDRETLRTVLSIAIIAASIYVGNVYGAGYGAALSIGGQLALNILVPPAIATQNTQAAAQIYNAALAGNVPKLDDPIPRTFGIDKFNPPFAAQPYVEYDANGDQYFYGVFCLGYGPLQILAEFVGKSPIASFADIITHTYLKPGAQPVVAKANVVTSAEVSGFELKPGRYVNVGGFVACQPRRTVASIGYDIIAPQGLGTPTDAVTVAWQIEYLRINDAGQALSDWEVLDTGTKTVNSNTPQRWSFKKDLPAPARVMVRMARTNLANTDANARDTIQWAGLRAYLQDAAPLNANASHYEVVMRASENLNGQTQSDFSLIAQGLTRTWNPTDGWNCDSGDFDNYVASRNPAWALGDLWTDPVWGEGLADERIDLETLYQLSLTWDTRQDRFDYTFLALTDAWTASQLIASSGRARVFRRYAVRALARDELAELGETAFTPRTCIGDMQMAEVLPRATDPDGIIIEYVSNVTWDKDVIECPCPGVTDILRPVYQSIDGIKGRTHANREGLYHAADMALRQRTVTCKTEMQALVASYLLPVRWMPMIPGYGQTGDVAFWDIDSLVMGLTEKADFSKGDTYLTLRRDDGSLTDPVKVLPGPTAWDVILPEAPDFEIIIDSGFRERPIFLLGPVKGDELVKISSIKDGGQSSKGAQYFDIAAVVDDPRVHQADNALLPGPGDIQDPIGLPNVPAEDDGEGGVLVVNLVPVDGLGVVHAISSGLENHALVTFHNDGTAAKLSTEEAPSESDLLNIWLLFGAVDPSLTALYEIRFTVRNDLYPPFFPGYFDFIPFDTPRTTPNIGTYDTWINLGTGDVTFGISNVTGDPPATPTTFGYAIVQVDIRKVGASVISATSNMAVFLV